MKLITVMAFVVLMSAACKVEQSKAPPAAPDKGDQPIVVSQERNFTDAELVIGKRICSVLKKKRELFETLTDMQEQFRFKGEARDCGAVNPSNVSEYTAAISNVSATDFEYVSTRANYFRDVITDQAGIMKTYCDAFAKNGPVSNQVSFSNSTIRLNLVITDGYDRFEVAKINKDNSVSSTEAVSVISSTSQASVKFFGVEKERIRYSACANATGKKQFSSVKQTWLEAVTPF